MTSVLCIGGTDSSGGAGLLRDAGVAQDLGFVAKPVVTCVTAQSNFAVHQILPMPTDLITAQIDAAFDDTPPKAVKIGMVGGADMAGAIVSALRGRDIPIVFDPVLKASSGGELSDQNGLHSLIAISTLVTPNAIEAAHLTGIKAEADLAGPTAQAEVLMKMGAHAVMIKGGHIQGDICSDRLFFRDKSTSFDAPRLSQNRRGTGCTLASAIACNLAAGYPLTQACARAKTYVHRWIASAEPNFGSGAT
ncbi:hydroxymethylpyrimidine/phosphomethylpyrimidine kinase [Aestuariibius sp. HNIBRBA575]|uniref:bifunctional hydroxymethylpyrimidine kinase/phosphomethylpyrimidine kinase n=1 Tax=Aestuariibius sp. HNIBRBA575 TaxID=3233343 RepID=UPI0034A40908